MFKKLLLPFLLITILLTSCGGGKKVEFTYEVKNLTFKFAPPYEDGFQTALADVDLQLEEIFKENNANPKKIDKVLLENTSITINNRDNFSGITNFTVEISGDAPMLTLANMPEIEPGQKVLNFPGSEKKDADKHFRAGKFTLLLSGNFSKEDTTVYELTANLTFKIKARAAK